MKKLRISAISTVVFLVFSLFFQVSAYAGENIKVKLNDKELLLEVTPTIIQDRVMVPLRDIFEALGVDVEWVETTRSINAIKDSRWIKLQIGRKEVTINGETKKIDVAPTIINSRTLVPLRLVAESFDAEVAWDGESRIVSITTGNTAPAEEKIVPPVSIPGEYKWKIIDTKNCKIYYYDRNETFIKKSAANIDKIVGNVNEKFNNTAPTTILNNNKLAVYFLDHDVLNDFFKGSISDVAGFWSIGHKTVFISMIYEYYPEEYINQTLTHEIIHAVSLGTKSIAKGVPGWYIEGLAECFKVHISKSSNIDYFSIKEAIWDKKVLPWSSITKSSGQWDDRTGLCYKQSKTIVGFLVETYGEKEVIQLIQSEGQFNDALTKLTSKSLEQLEEDWKNFVLKK